MDGAFDKIRKTVLRSSRASLSPFPAAAAAAAPSSCPTSRPTPSSMSLQRRFEPGARRARRSPRHRKLDETRRHGDTSAASELAAFASIPLPRECESFIRQLAGKWRARSRGCRYPRDC